MILFFSFHPAEKHLLWSELRCPVSVCVMPRRHCFSLCTERWEAGRLRWICLQGTHPCWQHSIRSKCKWEGFRSVLVREHTAERSPFTTTHRWQLLLQTRRLAHRRHVQASCITHALHRRQHECRANTAQVQNCWNPLKYTYVYQWQNAWPWQTCRYNF